MKAIAKIGMMFFVAASLFATTSCTEEFQVEESQLYGTWYFPLTLAPDTVTGFNWAGAEMIIKAPDTMWISNATSVPSWTSSDYKPVPFLWTLRDNNVTATITNPMPTMDEKYVVAFTVYEASAKKLKITGKYRYLYNGDNTAIGNISCTLSKTPPEVAQ